MLNWLSQAVAVTGLNLRTIGERRGASAAAVFGVAGVVAVFVAVLSIAEGFQKTMSASGSDDTALVLRSGSDSEMMSGLRRDATRIIADAPGVRRSGTGPQASAELFVVVDLPKRTTGTDANVPLRGIQTAAFDVRDEVKIIEGRRFRPGSNEVIVGRAAAAEFRGLDLGSRLRWGVNEWQVVGIFSANGGLPESEIWCDASVLQPAYRRGDTFQAVYAKLDSPQAFDRFKDSLTTDPRLDVKVIREKDYYADQSRTLYSIITGLGTIIAGLMAIGAVFGALNTMYTAVASRSREIATLRALGFGGGPVVLSVLTESLVLAVLGGALGATVAYFAFNGYQTATLNWSTFSQVAFAFAVTPRLLVQGIIYALVMGLIGGLPPAIRAARLPVATALREL
jgi:putative ABC transport system permease protein